MEKFLAKDVIERVEGLNSEKTLNRWRKAVLDNFGTEYFSVENIPFNHKGNRRPVTIYSLEDIKKFQTVADILSKQPSNRKNLKEAIITAFSSDSPLVKPKSELEVFADYVTGRFAELQNEDKRLLLAIQEINRKISKMQEALETIEENKPKLLKKKAKKEQTRW